MKKFSTRDNHFDMIRMVAAMMVFLGHMAVLLPYPVPSIMGQSVHGMGVIIFFLLGGYLITLSWERDPHVLRYACRRFFRIFPAFFCCVVITALVIGPIFTEIPLSDYFKHPQFGGYFRNLIFRIEFVLPAVFTKNPYPNVLNGSYWTLGPEVIMYFVIPIVYTIGDKLKIKKPLFTALAVLTGGFSIVLLQFFPDFHFVFYNMDIAQVSLLIPFYFIGAAIAVWKPDKKYFNVQLSLILYFLACCYTIEHPGLLRLVDLIVFSYLILSLGFNGPGISLEKFDISYGLYIWGFIIQQTVIHLALNVIQVPLPKSVIVLVSLALTVGISYLTFRFVEEPCKLLAKKLCKISRERQTKRAEAKKA